jgi:hypothetical protein
VNDIDYAGVALELSAHDWQWTLADGMTIQPTAADIKIAVEQMQKRMVKEDASTIMMGHLLLQRDSGHFELYVHAGTFGKEG